MDGLKRTRKHSLGTREGVSSESFSLLRFPSVHCSLLPAGWQKDSIILFVVISLTLGARKPAAPCCAGARRAHRWPSFGAA